MSELPPIASPTDELIARRTWTGATLAGGVLTEEIAAFCQSGVGVALASRDRDGWPVLARGRGCRIEADGRVRVLLRSGSGTAVLEAIAGGSQIAVTFSQPGSHRSIQLKAASAEIRPVEPADEVAAQAQSRIFRDLLIAAAYPEEFASVYCSAGDDVPAVIVLVPESAFVQTPGPGAGSRLDP
jgi:hypothetical protein